MVITVRPITSGSSCGLQATLPPGRCGGFPGLRLGKLPAKVSGEEPGPEPLRGRRRTELGWLALSLFHTCETTPRGHKKTYCGYPVLWKWCLRIGGRGNTLKTKVSCLLKRGRSVGDSCRARSRCLGKRRVCRGPGVARAHTRGGSHHFHSNRPADSYEYSVPWDVGAEC